MIFGQPLEFTLLALCLFLFLVFAIIVGASNTDDKKTRIAGAIFGIGAFGLGSYLLFRLHKTSLMGTVLRSAESLKIA
jgi:hypothetical protein